MTESNRDSEERESSPEIADLLRRSFEQAEKPAPSLLPSIQERIRVHTRGRYYRKREDLLRNPVLLMLATACFLLVLAAALYLTLGSLFGAKKSAPPGSPADSAQSK